MLIPHWLWLWVIRAREFVAVSSALCARWRNSPNFDLGHFRKCQSFIGMFEQFPQRLRQLDRWQAQRRRLSEC